MPAIRAMATQEALSGFFIVCPPHLIFLWENLISIAADERERDHVSDEFLAHCRIAAKTAAEPAHAKQSDGSNSKRYVGAHVPSV